MTFYINSIELANTNILKRTSADNWNVVHDPAENIPCIEQVNQKPTQWNLNIKFTGAGRYDMITSVRADIRDCEKILVQSTDKYLFGNQKYVWLAQSSFDVDEGAGKVISGTLQGMIDPYQIHTCDFTTSWTSDMTLSLSAAHDGKYSIKTVKTNPVGDTSYSATYNPEWALDIDDNEYIGMWFKASSIDYSHIRLYLYTDATHYSYATFPTLVANTWKWCAFALDSDFSAGATLSNIDYINISLLTDASPPATMTLNADNIRVA